MSLRPSMLALGLALGASAAQAQGPTPPASVRTPEATSLLGVPLFAADLPAERRATLEENLQKATADFVKDPDSADNIIWVGRRLAYLGRFREAIDVYTRGIAKHPGDARLLRHRGHRFITLRQFGRAVADFERAAQLIAGKPDQIEPDGDPNPAGVPTTSLGFNVWYHLGLAHYLKGDFDSALVAYRECMKVATLNDDRLVATSDWLYMTLRRRGRREEAARVLDAIRPDMRILENRSYLNRLLLYKGLKKPEELLGRGEPKDIATQGYGVANWYLYNGDTARAREILEKVVAGPQWIAFGFIAAEAELARMRTAS